MNFNIVIKSILLSLYKLVIVNTNYNVNTQNIKLL